MNDEAASRELSQKLLQGWTMLADSCPNEGCNVPLMERKRDNTIYCVSCKGYFDRDEDEGFIQQQPMEEVQRSTPAPSGTPKPTVPMKENGTLPNTATPTAPIDVRDKQLEQRVQQRIQKTNEVSKKIGEKLLQGWTLLEDVCQRCNTPLMRNREKKLFCLSCDLEVVSASDASNFKRTVLPTTTTTTIPQEPPRIERPLPSKPFQQQQTEKLSSSSSDSEQDETISRAPKKSRKRTSDSFVLENEKLGPSATLSSEQKSSDLGISIIDVTLSSIFKKMKECQERLVLTTDIDQLKAICGLISELAHAAKALQEARQFQTPNTKLL